MSDVLIFNLMRRKKREWSREAMAGLTQAEVDEVNAVLRDYKLGLSGGAGGAKDAQGPQTPPKPVSAPSGALRLSQAGIDLIHSFEQCKLTSYPDPGSRDGTPWTIGWGSTGPGITRGTVWTQAQADERFRQDVVKFENGVNRLLDGARTTQNQFDALVSLAYNIGLDEDADTIAEGLGDSSLLRKHKAGDYAGAAEAFKSWRFNDGREMRGLVRRRAAEAAMYRGQA